MSVTPSASNSPSQHVGQFQVPSVLETVNAELVRQGKPPVKPPQIDYNVITTPPRESMEARL